MAEHDFLAEQFEAERGHLTAVAYRMLGSAAEADDAVQESWIRLSRSDTSAVENLGGWLTTVVARVCLDMLRSRQSRREDFLGDEAVEPAIAGDTSANPEEAVVLADSVGIAMLVVLETLTPAERLAFVLHDMFAVPFDEIADIVGRSPTAARQLASRARRRVQGASPSAEANAQRQRQVVAAFLQASREGNFEALLAVLDPEVVLRADETAMRMGSRNGWLTTELRGAKEVAGQFNGTAQGAQLVLIDGAPGAAWVAGGKPRVLFVFAIEDGKVASIELLADPELLAEALVEYIDA